MRISDILLIIKIYLAVLAFIESMFFSHTSIDISDEKNKKEYHKRLKWFIVTWALFVAFSIWGNSATITILKYFVK